MNMVDEAKVAQIYVRIAEMLQENLGFPVSIDEDGYIVFNEFNRDADGDGRFLWFDSVKLPSTSSKMEDLFWTCGSYFSGEMIPSKLKYDSSDEEILNFVKENFTEYSCTPYIPPKS